MYQLTANLECVRPFFTNPQLGFMVDSIVAGNTPAQVYVNHPEHPAVAIVTEGHGAFFGGDASDATETERAIRFFTERIIDEPTKERLGILKLYPTSDRWQEALLASLAEYNPTVYWRCLFQHRLQHFPVVKERNDDVVIRAIDRNMVKDTQLANLQYMLSEITYMWGGVEPFLARGFGSCAIKGDQIICWCTGEYFSDAACGIGIETMEKFQGQGVATRTAVHFLRQCAERGFTPHWDSWKANQASVKVAVNAGFDQVLEYPIVFLKF